MDTPQVTHVPAQPRQRHHTAACTYVSTSTHGSPGKARAHARCPNPHPRSHYSQDLSYACPRSPRPATFPHSPLLCLRLHNFHHHNHLINHHQPHPHPALHPPSRGPNLPKGAPKPVLTASNPAATKAHAPTRPAPAARLKPKTAAKQQPKPVSPPRPQPAAKPKPKPKPGATRAARARPPEDVLYDIWPHTFQARRQQRPARRPLIVTYAAAITFMAERAAARAQRTSSRHLSKPAPQAQGPPPTGPEQRQGPPAASLPPYQPWMSAHIQHMPRWRRHRESQPSPEAETVLAYPRSPHLPAPPLPAHRTTRNPPGPPPPSVPTTPSHPPTPTPPSQTAAPPRDSDGGAGPTRSSGSWESGPRQSVPSRAWSTGPARGRWTTCRLQPAGGRMPQAAWEAMLAHALHPLGVHPRNLAAPKDQRYVIRRLRETFQETQRDGIRLWDITQSPAPHTHTPSPPHKPQRTNTSGTDSTPGALRATQHDAPDPPASGAAT